MNRFGRLLRLLKDPPPCLAGAAWGLAALFVLLALTPGAAVRV